MFSDSDTSSAGFSSNWTSARSVEECSVQTIEINGIDKDVQTKESHPVGVQTEEEVPLTTAKYDEDKLAKFLTQICPKVVEELDRVSRSNAFSSYYSSEEEEGEVKELLTLSPANMEGVKVSELSWSSTGSVLAVALSHSLHSSWCSHQGHVVLYNIDRENKSPSRKFEASSCIRSVSMHPYLSIVAAGTFSGEVMVWGSEEALSNESAASHDDSVTEVRWVIGTGTAVSLVSSGLDGRIFFWKVSPQLSSYKVLERYCFKLSSTEPGVTAFAFPHHKQDTFVVAVEGGALLHCSTTAAKPVAAVGSSEIMKDPVVSSFEALPATVTSLAFSPHHDYVFATVSTDQAIRIYSLYQRCAQRVMWSSESVVGVAWSPTQTHVLAGWGAGNALTLYDTSTGDILYPFCPDGTERKSCLSAAAFNEKSPRLLAVGDLDGGVRVWETPVHLPIKPKHL